MSTETLESARLEIPTAKRLYTSAGELAAPVVGFVESVEEGLSILCYTSAACRWRESDLPVDTYVWLFISKGELSNQVQLKAFYDKREWSAWIDSEENYPVLTVMISRSWMDRFDEHEGNTGAGIFERGLDRLIPVQTSLPYGREMLKDLLQLSVSLFERNLKIKKWVYVLIDSFYDRMSTVALTPTGQEGKKCDEATRLERIVVDLIADFQEAPPTVETLSRLAAMSSTKFKSLFKRRYGMAVYAFYQVQRMRFAKELLVTGQYTVHEVGRRVGYQNMSHFAAAFKKVHGELPGQVLGLK